MTFKTLRHKSNKEQFVHVIDKELYESEVPQLLVKQTTMEMVLKTITSVKMKSYLTDNYELVIVSIQVFNSN